MTKEEYMKIAVIYFEGLGMSEEEAGKTAQASWKLSEILQAEFPNKPFGVVEGILKAGRMFP